MPLASLPLVCLATAAIAVSPHAPVEAPKPTEGVLLEHRFAPGEAVRYQIEQKAKFVAAAKEVRDTQATSTRTDRRFEVISVAEDGTATVHLSIERAVLQVKFDESEPIAYDSAERDSKQLRPAAFDGIEKAIGRPLAEIKVRPDGTVADVRPLLRQDELDSIPGKLGLEGEATSNLFVPLPGRRVSVGDEWSDTAAVRVVLSGKITQEVKILRQYRLESVEKGIATINVKTAPLTVLTDPALLVQLIQRTTEGTIRFDIEAGRVLSRTTSFDNLEIGWAGPDSTYRAVSETTERLIKEPTAVSLR